MLIRLQSYLSAWYAVFSGSVIQEAPSASAALGHVDFLADWQVLGPFQIGTRGKGPPGNSRDENGI